jgi:Protein involved in biosynthesis of mitomycin antibiotics/polyketide fumonisin
MNNLRRSYETDGFVVCPPALPADLLARVHAHMDAVMAGQYETGVAPMVYAVGKPDPTRLVKIDQPHLADRTLYELCTHPVLGQHAAAITGARWVQLWAAQLLHKPPGGGAAGNVGWHQDYQYWKQLWTPASNVFTCWVAISDVPRDRGPLLFARGSHRWGFLNEGDFFGAALDDQRARILAKHGATWDEVPATMRAGAFSFHHRHTYHGSGPNCGDAPRRSFALHLRTDQSEPLPGGGCYVEHLDDPIHAPIIYREESNS